MNYGVILCYRISIKKTKTQSAGKIWGQWDRYIVFFSRAREPRAFLGEERGCEEAACKKGVWTGTRPHAKKGAWTRPRSGRMQKRGYEQSCEAVACEKGVVERAAKRSHAKRVVKRAAKRPHAKKGVWTRPRSGRMRKRVWTGPQSGRMRKGGVNRGLGTKWAQEDFQIFQKKTNNRIADSLTSHRMFSSNEMDPSICPTSREFFLVGAIFKRHLVLTFKYSKLTPSKRTSYFSIRKHSPTS